MTLARIPRGITPYTHISVSIQFLFICFPGLQWNLFLWMRNKNNLYKSQGRVVPCRIKFDLNADLIMICLINLNKTTVRVSSDNSLQYLTLVFSHCTLSPNDNTCRLRDVTILGVYTDAYLHLTRCMGWVNRKPSRLQLFAGLLKFTNTQECNKSFRKS